MIAILLAVGLVGADIPPAERNRACNAGMLHTSMDPALLMRPQDWPTAKARKLGELPKAKAELAVLRLVDGCMVPVRANYRLPEN